MHCPSCQHENTKVLDSRASGDGIRRRRQCHACEHRFTTHERIERRVPLVVKKDGSREPFDLDKVVAGLRLACRKRPVPAADIEAAATRVEALAQGHPGGEIEGGLIGRAVLAELQALDAIAYVRFASVYLEVDSPSEFLDLLRPLVERS